MAGEQGLNSELLRRFNALRAAAAAAGHNIGIGSGYRTVQEQINLRRTNGCPDVWKSKASSCKTPTAIPGQSNHNHGLAIDFTGNSAADSWVAANASRFGLHLPVPGENWHLEMIDDDGSHAHVQHGMENGALGFDIEMGMDADNPEDELANRIHTVLRLVGMGATDKTRGMPTPGDATIPGTTDSTTGAPFPSKNFDKAIRPMRQSSTPARRGKNQGTAARDEYIAYAKSKFAEFGWDESELPALIELWDRESNWNPNAQNPRSTAYGIAQFLNGTWGGTGYSKTDDPYTQIDAGLAYIRNRRQYGSPSRALSFHDAHNWY